MSLVKKILVFTLYTPLVVAWSIFTTIYAISGFFILRLERIINRALKWAGV